CAPDAQNPCGSLGYCNGTGACQQASNTTACGSATPVCDAAGASVVMDSVCNGAGKCTPKDTVSCNGFLCAGGVCGSSCSDDGACVAGGYCSAQSCVVNPNLAGNGDLETGTATGWSAVQGGSAPVVSSTAAAGYAHAGLYSIEQASRDQNYEGPSYIMPTGIGQYQISAYVMQNVDATSTCIVQARVQCVTNIYYGSVQTGTAFGMPLMQGVWTPFSATVDFNALPPGALGADCFPPAGLVKSASVFVNQINSDSPVPYVNPPLYMDDLVIQVSDGHNLCANSGFEAQAVDGWNVTGTGSSLATSGNAAHGGTYSLREYNRQVPTVGIKYLLPIGAARYAVSAWVYQTGTMNHSLMLQPAYSCIGSSAVVTPAVTGANGTTAVKAVAPSTWQQLSGTFVFPPADESSTCKLSMAAVYVLQGETGTCSAVECPDLYVDDASITLQ
ncbi:MAG TPA: carbohydrate binding domain-containing protein, partial [Polyangia bacterium]|nr:carbohydrate binding domain-containing protein [Polyangia bacterium]